MVNRYLLWKPEGKCHVRVQRVRKAQCGCGQRGHRSLAVTRKSNEGIVRFYRAIEASMLEVFGENFAQAIVLHIRAKVRVKPRQLVRCRASERRAYQSLGGV